MHQSWRRAAAVAVAAAGLQLAGCGTAQREAHYRASAARLLDDGKFQQAYALAHRAIELDPRDARARLLAARVAERLHDPKGALEQYLAALQLDPALAAARAGAGRIYLYARQAEQALGLAEQGLQFAPGDPQLLAVRAAARAERGDLQAALPDAEAAARAEPDDAYIVGLLSGLYARAGQTDKAVAVAAAAVDRAQWSIALRYVLAEALAGAKRGAEAAAQLREIVATEPRVAAHRLRLARLLDTQGDAAGAERALGDGVDATHDDALKLALVQYLGERQGPSAARGQLHRFLDAEPDNDNLNLLLAGYSERAGAVTEAEQLYRAVIAHSGVRERGLAARLRLARLRIAARDGTTAGQLVAEVLRARPQDADALLLRADLALADGKPAAAITDLQAIQRARPEDPAVLRVLARAQQAGGQIELAAQSLRAALARAPGDAATFEQLFRLQMQQQDYAQAHATAAALQQAQPKLALGPYLDGQVYEAEQQGDAALASYERALQLQPEVVEPLTALVRLQLAARHPERALARLDAAIAASPGNAPARNLKAEILLTQKRYDEAATLFGEATALLPSWPVPYRRLATLQMLQKQPEAAITTLTRGLAATGSPLELVTDLGAVYEAVGKPDEAIRLYDDYLKSDPKSPIALHNLATLLSSYRSDPASLERAAQLVAAIGAADDPRVLDTRGWIAFRSGDYAQAVPLLQQALERVPDSPLLHYRLGMAQYKSGDAAGARRNLEVAVKSGRGFPGVDDARATLATLRRSG